MLRMIRNRKGLEITTVVVLVFLIMAGTMGILAVMLTSTAGMEAARHAVLIEEAEIKNSNALAILLSTKIDTEVEKLRVEGGVEVSDFIEKTLDNPDGTADTYAALCTSLESRHGAGKFEFTVRFRQGSGDWTLANSCGDISKCRQDIQTEVVELPAPKKNNEFVKIEAGLRTCTG